MPISLTVSPSGSDTLLPVPVYADYGLGSFLKGYSSPDRTSAPFLTIQAALDYGLAVCADEISVAAGAYTAPIVLSDLAGRTNPRSPIVIKGAGPSTIIGTAGANCFSAVGAGAAVTLKDMTLQTTGSGSCISAVKGATVDYEGINFAVCAGHHVFAASNSVVTQSGNCTISGGAVNHLWADSGARINIATRQVTLSGTPAFSGKFAEATMNGSISAVLATFAGTGATGTRFNAASGGTINANGGGASFFPGSIAGTGTNPSASPYGLYV